MVLARAILRTMAPAVALLLAVAVPAAVGHDDSGSRYPGSNDGGVAGRYVGSAGLYSPLTGASPYQVLCDLEVGGDGAAHRSQDETSVDGISDTTGTALVVDGTWDDGGYGGACHTNSWAHDDYNTPGCAADKARASDAVLGGSVWIAAACDWQDSSGMCGADGTPDAMAFGSGSPGVTYPTAGFAASGCAAGDATMMVVVFDSLGGKATSGSIWAD